MEKKMKYLEMIQSIISRMASNSFSLKGWAITIVSGIFALSSKDADKFYSIVAYIPIIGFWGLDAYYLLQERLYRALYDKVRVINEKEEDVTFNMDTSPEEFHNSNNNYLGCFFSDKLCWFYLPLLLISTAVVIYSIVNSAS